MSSDSSASLVQYLPANREPAQGSLKRASRCYSATLVPEMEGHGSGQFVLLLFPWGQIAESYRGANFQESGK